MCPERVITVTVVLADHTFTTPLNGYTLIILWAFFFGFGWLVCFGGFGYFFPLWGEKMINFLM